MSMIDRDTDQNRPATSSRSSFGSMSDSSSSNSDNNSTSAPRRPSLTVSLPDDDGRYIKVEETFGSGYSSLAPTASGICDANTENTSNITELKLQTNNITRHNASIQQTTMSEEELENSRAYWRAEVQKWRIEAYKGNAIAAQNVGVALYKGELGVEKDEVEACKFFRMASQAGLSTSMFNLGWAYTSGSGVKQNWQRAVSWWKKAAAAGHGSAARNLGLLYTMGIAPDENGRAAVNLPEAFYWYNEAAKMGNHKAMHALANCYAQGLGVERNDEQATYWRNKYDEAQSDTSQIPE